MPVHNSRIRVHRPQARADDVSESVHLGGRGGKDVRILRSRNALGAHEWRPDSAAFASVQYTSKRSIAAITSRRNAAFLVMWSLYPFQNASGATIMSGRTDIRVPARNNEDVRSRTERRKSKRQREAIKEREWKAWRRDSGKKKSGNSLNEGRYNLLQANEHWNNLPSVESFV